MVLLSSGEKVDGLGSKWVMWRLPGDREKASFWNLSVASSAVKAAVQTPVMVYAWNGKKKVRRFHFIFQRILAPDFLCLKTANLYVKMFFLFKF